LPKVIKRGPDLPPQSSSVRPGAASSISPPSSQKPKAAPIIRSELVDATAEAKRIRQEAELEAAEIRQQAQVEAQEIHQQGYNDGYQEGLAAYTEQTTKAILQLRKSEENNEREFINLVRACVEKVLGQEIKLNPDAVTGIVRMALQDARQQREIIVRAHPDDVADLNKNKRKLLEVLARASAIEIREDNTITRGGCIVLTELGMIDASLERQLNAIEAAVEEEYREGLAGGGGGGYQDDEEQPDQEDDY
jgi:type III secretion system HrpE/YscL family protein